jgi:triphosphoribosyl-dephospho-CoA synthase
VSLQNKSSLNVTTLDDILRCTNLSSLLEVAGWPKPGNVHRTQDFTETRFEHFLAGVAGIQPEFRRFIKNIQENFTSHRSDLSYINLGKFFKDAAEQMMRWQEGGNVMLGHILILGPLVATAVICILKNNLHRKDFERILREIIDDSTVQDTVNLYKAISICNPGGLGKVAKYDLTDENGIKQIQHDEVTLKQIFEFSQDYDLISREYATGFEIILTEGLPFYFDVFNQTKDINFATVHTFLYLLSNHRDTLIIRKSGNEMANWVSEEALKVLEVGGLKTQEGRQLIQKMDERLQKQQGQLNPGTTADLLAGTIFCALIFGLKF